MKTKLLARKARLEARLLRLKVYSKRKLSKTETSMFTKETKRRLAELAFIETQLDED